MNHAITCRWPLGALMGQLSSHWFAAAEPLPPPPPKVDLYAKYPPGLSSWNPEVGDQKLPTAKHCWTGNYIVTFVIASIQATQAQSVLAPGMTLEKSLITSGDGAYPVVLGFGVFENARSSRYPFLGLNYTEFLAGIPRVYMPDKKYPYPGPYLYPFRLYLNRIMPVIFGWLSGYPKVLKRVSMTHGMSST